MSEAPTYNIRTVADFLDVPRERRPVCVAEFLAWCATHDVVRAMPPGVIRADESTYRWVDDDKGEVRFNVTAKIADEGKP